MHGVRLKPAGTNCPQTGTYSRNVVLSTRIKRPQCVTRALKRDSAQHLSWALFITATTKRVGNWFKLQTSRWIKSTSASKHACKPWKAAPRSDSAWCGEFNPFIRFMRRIRLHHPLSAWNYLKEPSTNAFKVFKLHRYYRLHSTVCVEAQVSPSQRR